MSLGISAAGWAAIGAIGSVAVSAYGTSEAADAQAEGASNAGNATLQAQREAIKAQQPILDGGYAATNKLMDLLGLSKNTGAPGFNSLNTPFSFDASQLESTPGYQFQLQQGQEALDRKAAAGGGFYSGAALKAAEGFGQDLARTNFDNEYSRQFNAYQTNRANTLNPLQALAGQGQSSANVVSGVQQNTGNTLANLYAGLGNAQGAASIAGANAIGSGITNGIGAWQQAQWLNRLTPKGYGPGGSQGYFTQWGLGGGYGSGTGGMGD